MSNYPENIVYADIQRSNPEIMKLFPEKMNKYKRRVYTDLPSNIETKWLCKIDKMYKARKDIFHEGELRIMIDFSNLLGPSISKGDVALLEAILGRVLPFIAKGSLTLSTIKEIWEDIDSYSPTLEDNPISFQGGWGVGWLY